MVTVSLYYVYGGGRQQTRERDGTHIFKEDIIFKTTSSILLVIILFLGAWDRTPLRAQDWTLPGVWERQVRDALDRYEECLQLGMDGAFSWTTTFTGRLDALTGHTPPPVIGAGGEAGVFPFEEGTWSIVQTGSYEVDRNRLRLTGTIAEVRVNEESLETFYTRLVEYGVEQYEAEEGLALTAEEKVAVVTSVVAQMMGEMEGILTQTWYQEFVFYWEGELLVLRDESGKGGRWRRVLEGTGVSAASWGQVKAQGR